MEVAKFFVTFGNKDLNSSIILILNSNSGKSQNGPLPPFLLSRTGLIRVGFAAITCPSGFSRADFQKSSSSCI